MTELTKEQAVDRLWRGGDISYLLHATQERMRADIASAKGIFYVVNSARRLGKSYLACSLAIEQCLQFSDSQVRYAAPTAKEVRKIVHPHMRSLLAECPADLQPSFNTMDGSWTFPNGSQIHVAGVNNEHADDLRGTSTDLGIVDEAGFVDDLEYLVHSVLMPQTMTTGGRIVMLSTPPRTPAHAFVSYCARAEVEGSYSRYTIHDAPHIDASTIATYCEEAGGVTSTTWRREYLTEFVVDESLAVLPEFSRVEDEIVEVRQRPPHFIPIIVMDVGYHDLSFALFGYHDFKNGVDVIEREYVANKTIARELNAACETIGVELWGERAKDASRYADAPPIVMAELPGWLPIAKTQTDGNWKAAVVNDVRTRLADKTIRVHPECKQLRAHCRYAVWRVPGKDLERMDGFGHFDGVDALAYFTRLIDRRTNPYPMRPAANPETMWWPHADPAKDSLKRLAQGARARR